MSVRYDGRRLRAYIDSLPQRDRRTIERFGEVAELAAKELAPVRTGELRDKIHFEMEGDVGVLYAEADHSGFLEFGTSEMAAQPYFIPGLEQARAALPEIARDEFRP